MAAAMPRAMRVAGQARTRRTGTVWSPRGPSWGPAEPVGPGTHGIHGLRTLDRHTHEHGRRFRIGMKTVLAYGLLLGSLLSGCEFSPKKASEGPDEGSNQWIQVVYGRTVWGGQEEEVAAWKEPVVDARFLADGSTVTLTATTQALVYSNPDGTIRQIIHPKGTSGLAWSSDVRALVVIPGDTVGVIDPGSRQIYFLDDEGTLIRTVQLPGESWGDEWHYLRGVGLIHDQIRRPEVLFRRDLSGKIVDTVFTFDYPKPNLGDHFQPVAPLYSTSGRWTVVDQGTLAIALSTATEILMLDWGDRSETYWEVTPLSEALGAEDRERLAELWSERLHYGDIPRDFASQLRLEFPDRLPEIGNLAGGPSGHLWVQDPPVLEDVRPYELGKGPLRELGGKEWRVFSTSGTYQGRVRFPHRLRILDVQESSLLTLWRDTDGSDRLAVWTVRVGEDVQ